MKRRHPMQAVVRDEHGVARFRENKIVRRLLDEGGIDLNRIAAWRRTGKIPREDEEQFAQLIGYSVSGVADLSYVSEETYALAVEAWAKLEANPELGHVYPAIDPEQKDGKGLYDDEGEDDR